MSLLQTIEFGDQVPAEPTFKARALPMIEMGVPVIRLKSGMKEPRDNAWPTLATTNADTILSWNEQSPNSNCGCVAKDDGVLFFETDEPGVIERYEKETGESFKTFTVQSSPGKLHFYLFQTDETRAAGNISQKILVWGSLRQSDQYVVSPLSIHPDTGKPYEIINASPIIPAPSSLIKWIVNQTKSTDSVAVPSEAKALSTTPSGLTVSVDPELKITEGVRDDTLASIAGSFLTWGLSKDEVYENLSAINRDHVFPSLNENDINRITGSICNGKRQTRDKHVLLIGGVPFDKKKGLVGLVVKQDAKVIGQYSASATSPVQTASTLSAEDEALALEYVKKDPTISLVEARLAVKGVIKTTEEVASSYLAALSEEDTSEEEFHYAGLIPFDGRAKLALGRKGTYKSTVLLGKALCDSSGRGWWGARNLLGPCRVTYLDFENSEQQGKKRINEMLDRLRFSAEERAFVIKNLTVLYLRKVEKVKGRPVDWQDRTLLRLINDVYKPVILYVDCFYKLHNEKPDEVMDVVYDFKSQFPTVRDFFFIHHLGRTARENIGKKKAQRMRDPGVGAEGFAQMLQGSIKVLQDAGLCIVLDLFESEPDELGDTHEILDIGIFGNNIQKTPIVEFKKMLSEDGDDLAHIWEPNTNRLSNTSGHILHACQGKLFGSRKDILGFVYGANSCNAARYKALRELQFYGLMAETAKGLDFSGNKSDVVQSVAKGQKSQELAAAWLQRILVVPMRETEVRPLAASAGIMLSDAHNPLPRFKSFKAYQDGSGDWFWAFGKDGEDAEHLERRENVRRLYEKNPKISVKELRALTGIPTNSLYRIREELGMLRKQKLGATRDEAEQAETIAQLDAVSPERFGPMDPVCLKAIADLGAEVVAQVEADAEAEAAWKAKTKPVEVSSFAVPSEEDIKW